MLGNLAQLAQMAGGAAGSRPGMSMRPGRGGSQSGPSPEQMKQMMDMLGKGVDALQANPQVKSLLSKFGLAGDSQPVSNTTKNTKAPSTQKAKELVKAKAKQAKDATGQALASGQKVLTEQAKKAGKVVASKADDASEQALANFLQIIFREVSSKASILKIVVGNKNYGSLIDKLKPLEDFIGMPIADFMKDLSNTPDDLANRIAKKTHKQFKQLNFSEVKKKAADTFTSIPPIPGFGLISDKVQYFLTEIESIVNGKTSSNSSNIKESAQTSSNKKTEDAKTNATKKVDSKKLNLLQKLNPIGAFKRASTPKKIAIAGGGALTAIIGIKVLKLAVAGFIATKAVGKGRQMLGMAPKNKIKQTGLFSKLNPFGGSKNNLTKSQKQKASKANPMDTMVPGVGGGDNSMMGVLSGMMNSEKADPADKGGLMKHGMNALTSIATGRPQDALGHGMKALTGQAAV